MSRYTLHQQVNMADESKPDPEELNITMIRYNQDTVMAEELHEISKAGQDVPAKGITWVNINGPTDSAFLQNLGSQYGFHPLALEDVQMQGQRCKVELYDHHMFIIMYALDSNDGQAQQVSIFCGQDFVVTLMPHKNSLFNPLQEMLQNPNSTLRKGGSDFLLYSLCDRIIDTIFPGLEEIRQELDEIEDRMFTMSRQDIVERLHRLRVTLVDRERIIQGAQEVIEDLRTGEITFIQQRTLVYLRDCYDHTLQQMHSIDSFRQIAVSTLESYLSLANNEMNQVIKVLTVIATIFIPLTFICSVYGMNFKYMPEINHPYGYPMVWIFMLVVALGMLVFFQRKKWL